MATITAGTNKSQGSTMPINRPFDNFGGSFGRERGTRSMRIDYDPDTTVWTTHLPANLAAHPTAPWLLFKSYQLRQLPRLGRYADLVLTYEQVEFTTPPATEDIPEDEVSENGSILEIDIVRHPEFDTTQATWSNKSMRDFYNPRDRRIFMADVVPDEYIDENGKTQISSAAGTTVPDEIRGMDKYVVGTGTVTVTEYFINEPASVVQDGGKREVPAGYPGTVENWLIMSARKARRGAWWVTETVYQFSEKAISGVVYEDRIL